MAALLKYSAFAAASWRALLAVFVTDDRRRRLDAALAALSADLLDRPTPTILSYKTQYFTIPRVEPSQKQPRSP